MTMDLPTCSLVIGGRVVAETYISDATDPKTRREQNLMLGVIAVHRVLSSYEPAHRLSPENRYTLSLSVVTKAMGDDDPTFKLELRRAFEQGGPLTFLWAQVRRAPGDLTCSSCKKTYYRHPQEKRLGGAIHTLCNGDLVKL